MPPEIIKKKAVKALPRAPLDVEKERLTKDIFSDMGRKEVIDQKMKDRRKRFDDIEDELDPIFQLPEKPVVLKPSSGVIKAERTRGIHKDKYKGRPVLHTDFFKKNGAVDFHKVIEYHNLITEGKINNDYHNSRRVDEFNMDLVNKGIKDKKIAHMQEFANTVHRLLNETKAKVEWNYNTPNAREDLMVRTWNSIGAKELLKHNIPD